MDESIIELKRICQKKIEEELYLFRIVYLKVSIYLTRLLLRTSITANQVTLFNIILILPGSALLFSFGIPSFSIAGGVLLQSSMLLDTIDGEIARYRMYKQMRTGHATLVGKILEDMTHCTFPLVFVGISFGLYNYFHDAIVFLFSFSIVLSFTLFYVVFESIPFDTTAEKLYRIDKNPMSQHTDEVRVLMLLYTSRRIRTTIRNFFNSSIMSLAILVCAALGQLYVPLFLYGTLLPPATVFFLYMRMRTL